MLRRRRAACRRGDHRKLGLRIGRGLRAAVGSWLGIGALAGPHGGVIVWWSGATRQRRRVPVRHHTATPACGGFALYARYRRAGAFGTTWRHRRVALRRHTAAASCSSPAPHGGTGVPRFRAIRAVPSSRRFRTTRRYRRAEVSAPHGDTVGSRSGATATASCSGPASHGDTGVPTFRHHTAAPSGRGSGNAQRQHRVPASTGTAARRVLNVSASHSGGVGSRRWCAHSFASPVAVSPSTGCGVGRYRHANAAVRCGAALRMRGLQPQRSACEGVGRGPPRARASGAVFRARRLRARSSAREGFGRGLPRA
ncbi:hypothetical protein BJY18_002876 [Amycolatopsis jiangsuensis]|uniref:Uncharacterized protein n=1 Tax=Amycolatopsis jiangsuensis TaxID=1181879 RepID=A0A840IS18_9PSEU|nr:hypothetical protein [Amycolatopsis jiangsuensis]